MGKVQSDTPVRMMADFFSQQIEAAEFHPESFLLTLFHAYLNIVENRDGDFQDFAPVVPLVDVYSWVTSSEERSKNYSKQEFARDIYRLHSSGVDTTKDGAKVSFPISRGVRGKTLTTTNETGGEVRYYGIRLFPAPQATQGFVSPVEQPLKVGEVPPRSHNNDDPDSFLTPPSKNPALEPEPGSIPPERPAGQDSSREADSEIYEGTVRLMVTTTGGLRGLLSFVGELRQDPQFRLLRLIANHRKEGMDIWLGLRQPLSLRTVLMNLKGVSRVTNDHDLASEDNEPRLIVVLSGT